MDVRLPDDGDMRLAGTPTSDRMTLAGSDDYTIALSQPAAALDGEWVDFSFDVVSRSSGPFAFTT